MKNIFYYFYYHCRAFLGLWAGPSPKKSGQITGPPMNRTNQENTIRHICQVTACSIVPKTVDMFHLSWLLTFFSLPVLVSSPKMNSFALGFSHIEVKSPVTPFDSAHRSKACLLGLITATRHDSKLFPYTHIWRHR